MNWDIYHFHHVCIQRGSEGVYTGLTNFVNDWKAANEGNNSALYVSENEWNSAKMRNPSINDFWHSQVGLYEAKRMDAASVGKISVLEGGTLFFNCETPLSFERYKQFDWMSKLGFLSHPSIHLIYLSHLSILSIHLIHPSHPLSPSNLIQLSYQNQVFFTNSPTFSSEMKGSSYGNFHGCIHSITFWWTDVRIRLPTSGS